MRIALVCPYSVSTPGGVQHQVLGLADELRLLGHHADVIAPCHGDPPIGVIAVGRSRRFRVNGSTAPMAPGPMAAARTVRTLKRGRYDVVHLHEPLAPSITWAALLWRGAPVVGTFHAAGDRTPYRWFGRPLRRLARRLDVRVAVSDASLRLAVRHLGGSYEVLPNALDPEPYRATVRTTGDVPTVLFIGRHEARKGLRVLLDAFDILDAKATLCIVGTGPLTRGLKRRHRLDPRIRWAGAVSDAEKRRLLRSADVVCVPALGGESFGLVLLEAMAAGVPVVASDLAGHRAAAGDAAVLVPPDDALALATGLRRVLCDAHLAQDLRVRGTTRANANSLRALAKRYVATYERATISAGAHTAATVGAQGMRC